MFLSTCDTCGIFGICEVSNNGDYICTDCMGLEIEEIEVNENVWIIKTKKNQSN